MLPSGVVFRIIDAKCQHKRFLLHVPTSGSSNEQYPQLPSARAVSSGHQPENPQFPQDLRILCSVQVFIDTGQAFTFLLTQFPQQAHVLCCIAKHVVHGHPVLLLSSSSGVWHSALQSVLTTSERHCFSSILWVCPRTVSALCFLLLTERSSARAFHVIGYVKPMCFLTSMTCFAACDQTLASQFRRSSFFSCCSLTRTSKSCHYRTSS